MFTIIDNQNLNTEKNSAVRLREELFNILAAALLGISSFAALISTFDLGNFWPDNMFRGPLKTSILSVWNAVAEKFGETDYVLLSRYNAGSAGSSYPGIFLTIALILIFAISFLVIKSRIRPMLLIYPAIFLVLTLFALTPALSYTILFVFALAVAWLTMTDRTGTDIRSWIIPAGVVVLIFGLISTGWLGGANPIIKKIKSHYNNAQDTIGRTVENIRFNKPALSGGDVKSVNNNSLDKTRGKLSRSDLENLKNGKHTSKKVAMTVTFDKEPESLYLKGFVGEEYNFDNWETRSTKESYEARDKLWWIRNRGSFSALTQINDVSKLINKNKYYEKNNKSTHVSPGSQTISVKVKKANRKYLYVPYELATKEIRTAPDRDQAYFQSGGLAGSSSYSYKAAFNSASNSASGSGSKNLTSNWTDEASCLLANLPGNSNYYKSESVYCAFANDNYLQLPTGKSTELVNKLKDYDGKFKKPEYPNYIGSIKLVKKYLSSKSKEYKNDIDYATQATLLFRALNIPARYVEGYLITPGDAASAKKSSSGDKKQSVVEVKQDSAHAWTEIYINGYGWVPVETTPDYEGVMDEANMNTGITGAKKSSSSSTKNKTTATDKTKNPSTESNGDEEKSVKQVNPKTFVMMAGMIIAAFLIIAAILFLLRKLVLAIRAFIRRNESFHDKDCTAAVCSVYQYMADHKLPISPAAERTGLRAAYSPADSTEYDRELMLDELHLRRKEKLKETAANLQKRVKGIFIRKK